jgi:hypothetical protein
MNRILKIILTILAVIVLVVVGAYAYLGGFHTVAIEEKEMGPFHFAYREMVGADFSKVGEITTALDVELRRKGFTTLQPFDLFNPNGGGEIGFVVSESEAPMLTTLNSSIRIKTIPSQQCMVTTFPWRNLMSYMIGFMKVDPALKAHREKNGYRKTWAATRHDGDHITYLQPIVKELIAPQ